MYETNQKRWEREKKAIILRGGKNLKLYNHNWIQVLEPTSELDAKEEQWCEDNQDYILNIN